MKPDSSPPKKPLATASAQHVHPPARKALPWGTVLAASCAIGGTFVMLRQPTNPANEPGDAKKVTEVERSEAPAQAAAPTSGSVKPGIGPATVPAEELAAMEAGNTPSVVNPVPSDPVPAVPAKSPAEATPTPLSQEAALVLNSPEAARESHQQLDKRMLLRAINEKSWSQYRLLLQKSLTQAIQAAPRGRGSNLHDAIWADPVLYRALLRWRVLGWFSESAISQHIADSYAAGVLLWLFNQPAAMEELLLTLHPSDDPSKVLKFLVDAWSLEEKRFEKYFSLALACAVVFDREMAIPNQVGTSASSQEEVLVNPLKRFTWYVEKNEGGKLVVPVHRQTARDLVWVVSAPVVVSELEWALSKLSYRRKNWGDAYGKVEYLMERAVNGESPYDEYSFEEILKHGGICGDRAYFCVHTARANGIPAMIIGGETDAGGHAWVGMKTDDDEWTTGIGRVGGAAKGMAENPQTGQGLSEQEIQLWNDRYHRSPAHTLAVHRHLWLATFFGESDDKAAEASAIRIANQLGNSFVESWQALFGILKRETRMEGAPPKPKNLNEWKDFVAGMRREFKDNPRVAGLADDAEMEFVLPYLEGSEAKLRLTRERRRIERNSGEQADLLAESVKRQATLALTKGDAESKKEISRLYDRALRDYGSNVTSFRMMANDYFNLVRNDRELAGKAVRDIELAYKRVQESGTTDFFRAGAEAGLARMIAGFYRQIGEEDRARLIEKRYETLERRARRGAL